MQGPEELQNSSIWAIENEASKTRLSYEVVHTDEFKVMSFISNLSTGTRDGRTAQAAALQSRSMPKLQRDEPTAIVSSQDLSPHVAGSSQLKTPAENGQSNPKVSSVAQPYETSLTDPVQSIIPELQPIFSLLNDHANKLYQEGYFLKLDDQNTRNYPSLILPLQI